jgi:hypothetical protein
MKSHAIAFGAAFASDFGTTSAGCDKREVPLFQAMRKSLKAIGNSPDVVVEEYHGTSHQVTFKGNGSYSRNCARCELSDLMVLVFDEEANDARPTYIQAKSERAVPGNADGIADSHLAANLEQWDLLARRPRIRGVGSFNPPADLLSSAQLDSVGSFVFFLHSAHGVDIYYAAARHLQMRPGCASRQGKLIAVRDACRCVPGPECLSVHGNKEFAASLLGLMIGTPVLCSGRPTTPPVCIWLAAQLRGLSVAPLGGDRPELASMLADLLDPQRGPPAETPNVGATSLLIFGVGHEKRT